MEDRTSDTEELRAIQLERESAEREKADAAESAAERHAAARRADKARYLRRKLDEQAASED